MTESISRREFLRRTVQTGTAITLGGMLTRLSAGPSVVARPKLNLRKDPDGICDLPEGFSYRVISPHGETMSDGVPVPKYHDGMGCFAGPDGQIILVRNHEMKLFFPADPPSPVPDMAYDPDASGGTTTIWLDKDLNVIKHHLSLTGTILNCSGGVTPWNTWISCEEVGDEGWVMGKRHGYCFEVNPLDPLKKIEPLKAMGRFEHEAVAVDPASGVVYETEDHMNGCFYRFLPNVKGELSKGGTLQALKFADSNTTDTTRDGLDMHTPCRCEWVNIDDPDPETNTVRHQARAKGAAVFVRGEGVVAHADGIYFTCTEGGAMGIGQIFRYVPDVDDHKGGGTIELVFECTERGALELPDNITVNRFGDLIICEDNGLEKQCLVGLTPEGSLYYIASNTRSEWAGSCFSPDGDILFANIQKHPGMTVAISGPWEKLRSST